MYIVDAFAECHAFYGKREITLGAARRIAAYFASFGGEALREFGEVGRWPALGTLQTEMRTYLDYVSMQEGSNEQVAYNMLGTYLINCYPRT